MTRRYAIDADVVAEQTQPGGIFEWSSLVDTILVAGHCRHPLVVHISTRDTCEMGWDHCMFQSPMVQAQRS